MKTPVKRLLWANIAVVIIPKLVYNIESFVFGIYLK